MSLNTIKGKGKKEKKKKTFKVLQLFFSVQFFPELGPDNPMAFRTKT